MAVQTGWPHENNASPALSLINALMDRKKNELLFYVGNFQPVWGTEFLKNPND